MSDPDLLPDPEGFFSFEKGKENDAQLSNVPQTRRALSMNTDILEQNTFIELQNRLTKAEENRDQYKHGLDELTLKLNEAKENQQLAAEIGEELRIDKETIERLLNDQHERSLELKVELEKSLEDQSKIEFEKDVLQLENDQISSLNDEIAHLMELCKTHTDQFNDLEHSNKEINAKFVQEEETAKSLQESVNTLNEELIRKATELEEMELENRELSKLKHKLEAEKSLQDAEGYELREHKIEKLQKITETLKMKNRSLLERLQTQQTLCEADREHIQRLEEHQHSLTFDGKTYNDVLPFRETSPSEFNDSLASEFSEAGQKVSQTLFLSTDELKIFKTDFEELTQTLASKSDVYSLASKSDVDGLASQIETVIEILRVHFDSISSLNKTMLANSQSPSSISDDLTDLETSFDENSLNSNNSTNKRSQEGCADYGGNESKTNIDENNANPSSMLQKKFDKIDCESTVSSIFQNTCENRLKLIEDVAISLNESQIRVECGVQSLISQHNLKNSTPGSFINLV